MAAVAHVAFDTLKFVETLISAGMPAPQAKALSIAQKEIFEEVLDGTLATKADLNDVKAELKTEIADVKVELKADIAELRVEMADVKSDVKLLKWMVGVIVAGVGALILKTFF